MDWTTIVCMFIGGLAFFLWGMTQMVRYLEVIAGPSMKKVIGKCTGNRFTAAATGCGVTCLNNSSSITTVLMIGFISSGLMTLQQGVGIIMGANIGSTITAQLVSFNMMNFAMIMFAISTVMWSVKWRVPLAKVLMGLSVIFVGMWLMKTGMKPLRTYEPFLEIMKQGDSVLISVVIGAVFTAVIQSSAATTGIVIAMASSGLISLEAAIGISFGANIGTCATALLASIGKPREAVRAAVVHILFNVLGVVLWIGFIPELSSWTMEFSNDISRQIANVHTFFNVANTVIFIGFTGVFAKVVEMIVPKTYQERVDRGEGYWEYETLDSGEVVQFYVEDDDDD